MDDVEVGGIFLEASVEIDDATYQTFEQVLLETTDIVGELGDVCDAGPLPIGHVPFEYETPAWRGEVSDSPATDQIKF